MGLVRRPNEQLEYREATAEVESRASISREPPLYSTFALKGAVAVSTLNDTSAPSRVPNPANPNSSELSCSDSIKWVELVETGIDK